MKNMLNNTISIVFLTVLGERSSSLSAIKIPLQLQPHHLCHDFQYNVK